MQPYTAADAERDLRAAIDDGDHDRITRASDALDRLDAAERGAGPSLLGSALWYAEHGLHVFPLSPGSKIPFKGSKGCKDATTNPDRIRAWWTTTPDANIGIATGHTVDVVDIDGVEGQRSRAKQWDDIFAKIDADNLGKVLTPRAGGMHIYLPATGDGNAAGIVPGVDYRGLGGYVVAPPSRTPDGRYEWLGAPHIPTVAKGAA